MSSIEEKSVESNWEEMLHSDNIKGNEVEMIMSSKEVVSVEEKPQCNGLGENSPCVIVSTSSANDTKPTSKTANHRKKLLVTNQPGVPILQLSEIEVKDNKVQFLIVNQSEHAEREIMYITQCQETKSKLQEICIPKEVTNVTDFNSLKDLNKLLEDDSFKDTQDVSVTDEELGAMLSDFNFSKEINDSVIVVDPLEIIARKLLVINQPGEAILKLINVLCSERRLKKYIVINIARKARRELVFFEPVIISAELYNQFSCKTNEEKSDETSSQLVTTNKVHEDNLNLNAVRTEPNLPFPCINDESVNIGNGSKCVVDGKKQLTQSELLMQAIINAQKENSSDGSVKFDELLEIEDMEINVDEEENEVVAFNRNPCLHNSSDISNDALPMKQECNNAEGVSNVGTKLRNTETNLEKVCMEEENGRHLFHNFLFTFSAHLIIVNHPGEPIIKFLFPSHVEEKNSYLIINQSCEAGRELLFVTELGEIKEQLSDASKPDIIKSKYIKIIRTKKGKKKIIYERSSPDTEPTQSDCPNSNNQKKIIKMNQPGGAIVKFITINSPEDKTNEVIVINMSRTALREVKIIKQGEATKDATTFDEIGNMKSKVLTIKHSGNEKIHTINFENNGIVQREVVINNPLTEVLNEANSGGKKRKNSDSNIFNQTKNTPTHCVSSPPRSKIVIVRSQRPAYIVSKSSSGKRKFIRVKRTHRAKEKVTYPTSSSVESQRNTADRVNFEECVTASNEGISQERKRKINTTEIDPQHKIKRIDENTGTNISNSIIIPTNVVHQEIQSPRFLSNANQQEQLKGIPLNVYPPNHSETAEVAGAAEYSLSSHFTEVAQRNVFVVNHISDSGPDGAVLDTLRKLKNTVVVHADVKKEQQNSGISSTTVNSKVTDIVSNNTKDIGIRYSNPLQKLFHSTCPIQSHRSILKYPCCSREVTHLANNPENFHMYAVHNLPQIKNVAIFGGGNKNFTYRFLVANKKNECIKSAYMFCRAQEKLKLNTASNNIQAVSFINEKLKNMSERNSSVCRDVQEKQTDFNEINCFCQNNLHGNEVPKSNVIPGILSKESSNVKCNWYSLRNFLWVEGGSKIDDLKELSETLYNADSLYELFNVLHDTETRENFQRTVVRNAFGEISGNFFTTELLSTFVSSKCQNNNNSRLQLKDRMVFTNHSCAAEHFNNYGFHFVDSKAKGCQNGENTSDGLVTPLLTFTIVFEHTGRLKRIISLNQLQESKSQVKLMVQSIDQNREIEISYKEQKTGQLKSIKKLTDFNEALYFITDPSVSKTKLIVVNQKDCCKLTFANINVPGIGKQNFIIANQSEESVHGIVNLIISENHTSAIFERVDKSGELTGNVIKIPLSTEDTESFVRFIKAKTEFSEKCSDSGIVDSSENKKFHEDFVEHRESVSVNYSKGCENSLKVDEFKEKDDCTEKQDECAEKQDNCTEKQDDCTEKQDDCTEKQDDCTGKQDGCTEKQDDCTEKQGDYTQKKDDCTKTQDDCTKKQNDCTEKQDVSIIVLNEECKEEKDLNASNIDSVSGIKDLIFDKVERIIDVNKSDSLHDNTTYDMQNKRTSQYNINQKIETQQSPLKDHIDDVLLLPPIISETEHTELENSTCTGINSVNFPVKEELTLIHNKTNIFQSEGVSEPSTNACLSIPRSDSIMLLIQDIVELLFDVLLEFPDKFSSDYVPSYEAEIHADIEYLYAALCKKSDSDFTKELSKRHRLSSYAKVLQCKSDITNISLIPENVFPDGDNEIDNSEFKDAETYSEVPVKQIDSQLVCDKSLPSKVTYLLQKVKKVLDICPNTTERRNLYSLLLSNENNENNVLHINKSSDIKLITENKDQNIDETKADISDVQEVEVDRTSETQKEISEVACLESQKLNPSNICEKTTNSCSVYDFIIDVLNNLKVDECEPADTSMDDIDPNIDLDMMSMRYDGISHRNPFLSFSEFRHRANTYNNIDWKNCGLKVLQLARNGWLYEEAHGLIYCDLCLEVLQESDHDTVRSGMLQSSHEEDCFWRRHMCPSSFLRVPASKVQNSLVNNIHLFYKNFERFIPKIQDTQFEKLGLNITTILAVTQYTGIPLNEISLASVVLALCGWRPFNKPLTIKCFYCTKIVECEEFTSVSQHIRNVTSEKIISTYDMAVEKVKTMLKDKKCNAKMISEMIYLEMCQMWWSNKETDGTNMNQIYGGQPPPQGKPNGSAKKKDKTVTEKKDENRLSSRNVQEVRNKLDKNFEINTALSNKVDINVAVMSNFKQDDFDFKKPDSLDFFSSKFLKKKVNIKNQVIAKESDKTLAVSSKNKESSKSSARIVNVNAGDKLTPYMVNSLKTDSKNNNDSSLKQLNGSEQNCTQRMPVGNKGCTVILPITVTSANYPTTERLKLEHSAGKNLISNVLVENSVNKEENIGVLENSKPDCSIQATGGACTKVHVEEETDLTITDDICTASKLFKYVNSGKSSEPFTKSQVKYEKQLTGALMFDRNTTQINPRLRSKDKEIEVVQIGTPVKTEEEYCTKQNRHSAAVSEETDSAEIKQQNFQGFKESEETLLLENSASKTVPENACELFSNESMMKQLPEEMSTNFVRNSLELSDDSQCVNERENDVSYHNVVSNNSCCKNTTEKPGESSIEGNGTSQRDLPNVERNDQSSLESPSCVKVSDEKVKRVKKVIMNIEDYKSLLACRKFLDIYGTKETTDHVKHVGNKLGSADTSNNEVLAVNEGLEISTSGELESVQNKEMVEKCFSLENCLEPCKRKKIHDKSALEICDNSHLEIQSVGSISSHNLLMPQIVHKHLSHNTKHEHSVKSVPKFLCTPAPISSVVESRTKESENVNIANTKTCMSFSQRLTCPTNRDSLMCTNCDENSENQNTFHLHKLNSGIGIHDGTAMRKKKVCKKFERNRLQENDSSKNLSAPCDLQLLQNISNSKDTNTKHTPNSVEFHNMHILVDKSVRLESHCKNLFSSESCLSSYENTQVFRDTEIISESVPNVTNTSHCKSAAENILKVKSTHNHPLLKEPRLDEIPNYASVLLQPLQQGENTAEKTHSGSVPKPVLEMSAAYPKTSEYHANTQLRQSPVFGQEDIVLHSSSKAETCFEMFAGQAEIQSNKCSEDFSPKKFPANTFQPCKVHNGTNCIFDHSVNNYPLFHNQYNEPCCDKSNYRLCGNHNILPPRFKRTEHANEKSVDDELLFSLASQFSNYNRTDISQLKQQLDTVDIMLKNIDRLKQHKSCLPDFDPINSHHFWCVWRIPTFMRNKKRNRQACVPGWHAVIFHLLQNEQFLCNPNVDPKFVDFLKTQLAMLGSTK